jgi:hypothetical protein
MAFFCLESGFVLCLEFKIQDLTSLANDVRLVSIGV